MAVTLIRLEADLCVFILGIGLAFSCWGCCFLFLLFLLLGRGNQALPPDSLRGARRDSAIAYNLARTNAELAPFAAIALELGIAYRAADDGLLLDEPGLEDLLAGLPTDVPPALALAGSSARSRLARSLVAWSLPHPSAAALRASATQRAASVSSRSRRNARRPNVRTNVSTHASLRSA